MSQDEKTLGDYANCCSSLTSNKKKKHVLARVFNGSKVVSFMVSSAQRWNVNVLNHQENKARENNGGHVSNLLSDGAPRQNPLKKRRYVAA